MLIAMATSQTQFPTINGGPQGGQTGYQVSTVAKWADSASQTQGGTSVEVFIPQGTKRTHFNQLVIDAITSAVNISSGLTA